VPKAQGKLDPRARISKDEKWLLTGPRVSVSDRRQGCANALRKIRRIIGRLRSLVDQGSPPQFVEWQRRIHTAGVIEVMSIKPFSRCRTSNRPTRPATFA
jgi:hypothetical protein